MSPHPPSPHTPERWDAASRAYAEKIASITGDFARDIIDRLALSEESDVLEVAAGSGALTEMLSPRVRSVLATDFSPSMIEILGERLRAAGATNVRTAVMDGQSLDVEDSSFDAAACNFALMLFPDRACGFRELARAVRPGGRAAVTGWTGPDRFEAFGLFMASVAKGLPDLPSPPSPPPIFSLADPARFKQEMESAGFRDVTIDFVTREQEVEGIDDLWDGLSAGAPPVQALFDRVGAEGQNRIRKALEHIVLERYGDGSFTLTNVATLGSGVVA
ncbi:MAG: methyltransferase domain-containing protein [Gemmatimonadota bacterium]|jgi:SAM-dependent methyltransferase